MYKHAGQFIATNPALAVRASQEHEPVPPPWAVVAFRRSRDNAGRQRVYRRVWAFEREDKACRRFIACDPAVYEDKRIVRNGVPTGSTGDSPIVAEWRATRRGVNVGADPWVAAKYVARERPENRGASYTERP